MWEDLNKFWQFSYLVSRLKFEVGGIRAQTYTPKFSNILREATKWIIYLLGGFNLLIICLHVPNKWISCNWMLVLVEAHIRCSSQLPVWNTRINFCLLFRSGMMLLDTGMVMNNTWRRHWNGFSSMVWYDASLSFSFHKVLIL